MCIWQTNETSSKSKYDQWKKHYFTFNTIFFHSIIPSILLLVINWLILCSLSRQRVVLSKIGSIDARHVLKREKQFKEKTIQLVLSSFFVIFTISPRYILTMVNAFATNLSKTPLMPLYIYVNLNTVFRVLEMSNYSLNLMFAIMRYVYTLDMFHVDKFVSLCRPLRLMFIVDRYESYFFSGRTSRREIRKLLRECFLWRFQRTRTGHRSSRIHTHSSLFDDDDDDTERSIATTAPATTTTTSTTPYCALSSHSHARSHHMSSSMKKSRQGSSFTCCGLTIDLSHKHSSDLSNGDSLSRHSTIGKTATNYTNPNCLSATTTNHYHYSPRKNRTYSQSPMSLSSFDRHLEQQQNLSYKSNRNTNRTLARRRATTAVHCFRHLPSSTIASITNKSLTFNADPTSIRSSISNDNDCSSNSILQPNPSDSPSMPVLDAYPTDSPIMQDKAHVVTSCVKNDFEEQPLAAYVVETC
jgi:hypothetical protein